MKMEEEEEKLLKESKREGGPENKDIKEEPLS